MQFLGAKHSHGSLSFVFSCYFSKLTIKIFHSSFKYFENQFSMCVTSWVLLFPKQANMPGTCSERQLSEGCSLNTGLVAFCIYVTQGSSWCVKLSLAMILRKHTKHTLRISKAQLFSNPFKQPWHVSGLLLQPQRADFSAEYVAGSDAYNAELPCFAPSLDMYLCSGLRCSQNVVSHSSLDAVTLKLLCFDPHVNKISLS